jgi:hypothetical protein
MSRWILKGVMLDFYADIDDYSLASVPAAAANLIDEDAGYTLRFAVHVVVLVCFAGKKTIRH